MLPEIVVDTNVIIAGLRSNLGYAYKLLQLIGTEKFNMNISVPLILEYQDVLTRQSLILGLSQNEVDQLVNYYCSVATEHEIFYLWRPTLKDPKDEMVLELAVKAQCPFIISFNKKDFAGAEQFNVKVLTPKEFLIMLGE